MSLRVREVLEAAREAALSIRRGEEVAELRRRSIGVQGHGYDVHSKSGILDPTRKIDSVLDWEMERAASHDLTRPIDEAYEIVRGAEHISDSLTIEVVTRYYLQAESYIEIARDLVENRGMEQLKGLRELKRRDQVKVISQSVDEAILSWERIGIAHLKEMAR